jgi:hypothetical protein
VARRCGGGALHDRGRCRWGVGQRKPQTTPAAGRRPLGNRIEQYVAHQGPGPTEFSSKGVEFCHLAWYLKIHFKCSINM